MSPLELRIIAYAISALVLFGGSGFIGYRLTANHYEALIARDKEAQGRALQDAQDKVIAAQKAQADATQTAEKQYAALKSNYDSLSSSLARSVSEYSTIHSGLVSATAATTAVADAASQSARRTGELTELVRQAASACAGDSAQLTALQTWAHSVSQ